MKGIIALDIDGTITANHHHLEKEVATFLKSLVEQQWFLVFITGRTFAWGYEVLDELDFPYYFAVHNGATIFEMPTRKIISRQLISKSILPQVDAIFLNQRDDYTLYTDEGERPICYYRPDRYSSEMLTYLEKRYQKLNEAWIPVETFNGLPFSEFSALKYFGSKKEAEWVSKELENLDLHAPIIKDPFDPNVYIIQATHENVTKGSALLHLKSHLAITGPVIAAGDDNNDATMLAKADIRVVMATAPETLLKEAHVIAPPAKENGIIQGLTEALLCISK